MDDDTLSGYTTVAEAARLLGLSIKQVHVMKDELGLVQARPRGQYAVPVAALYELLQERLARLDRRRRRLQRSIARLESGDYKPSRPPEELLYRPAIDHPWLDKYRQPQNPGRDAEILRLAQAGKTYEEIAASFGISKQRVGQLLAAQGYKRGRGTPNEKRDAEIRRLRREGLSYGAIAVRVGLSARQVWEVCNKRRAQAWREKYLTDEEE